MLKFIYGVMGSSKSAQALITQYNYKQNSFNVIILKPSTDTRDPGVLRSRIGLEAPCITFKNNDNLKAIIYSYAMDNKMILDDPTIIIVDEAQFCTKEQIEQLKDISLSVDVFCYGLLTNFKTELFSGSKRLIELSDSLEKIDHVCKCGKQALINAKFCNGIIVTEGEEIQIGDIEYEPMCYKCYIQELQHKNYKEFLEN